MTILYFQDYADDVDDGENEQDDPKNYSVQLLLPPKELHLLLHHFLLVHPLDADEVFNLSPLEKLERQRRHEAEAFETTEGNEGPVTRRRLVSISIRDELCVQAVWVIEELCRCF